jgi:putative oxidoreductase
MNTTTVGNQWAASLGRILIGAFYVAMGLGLVKDFATVTGLMAVKHVPQPTVLLIVTIAVWVAGGAALISGFRRKQAALLLLVLTAIVTVFIHNFWAADPAHFPNELQHFFKNVAICGALLGLFAG